MAPTFEVTSRFEADWSRLDAAAKQRFVVAKGHLVADVRAGRVPRPGLRVKRVVGSDGVWEMTFAPDGRATFEYGAEIRPGEVHVVWRRIGSHAVLDRA